MVCVGRKAQVLARRGMDIWRGNHPSRRRAFSAVLTRSGVYLTKSRTAQRVDVLIPTAVLHVVQAVLNAPVVAEPSKQFLWSAPPGTQAGQQIPALPAHLPGAYVHRLLLHHRPLPRSGKAQLIPDIVGQCLIGPDATRFSITPAFFPGSPPVAVPQFRPRQSHPPMPPGTSGWFPLIQHQVVPYRS